MFPLRKSAGVFAHPILALWLLGSLLGLGTRAAHGQGRDGPVLPPGVSRPEETPAQSRVPPQVFIDAIEVDWTDPELRARLRVFENAETASPSWSDLAAEHSSGVLIQLSVRGPRGGDLILTAEGASPKDEPRSGSPFVVEHAPPVESTEAEPPDRVHVGGIAPWTFTGPGLRGQPGWNGALATGGASVALRWLGTANEWVLRPPAYAFGERLLLSSLNPLTGQGGFFLVRNRTGRALELGALTPWVGDAFAGQHLIAVHADGPDVAVGQGNWRLGEPGGEGAAPLPGAVLVLEGRRSGDLQDLGRLGEAQISSSSYEFAYPPSQVISGRLWPVALRPPIWMGRKPGERAQGPAWIDLELPRTSPVEAVRLIHPGAAGWSSHFNPRKLRVELRSGREVAPVHEIEITPESSVTVVRFPEAFPLRGLRVNFEEPGGFGLPAAPSLMALQVMGRAVD